MTIDERVKKLGEEAATKELDAHQFRRFPMSKDYDVTAIARRNFLAGSLATLKLLAEAQEGFPPRLWANATFMVPGERPAWTATDTDDPEPGLVEFMSCREHQASQAKLVAEVARLREALDKIASPTPSVGSGKTAAGIYREIAMEALKKEPGV